jgi:hypothetical protein
LHGKKAEEGGMTAHFLWLQNLGPKCTSKLHGGNIHFEKQDQPELELSMSTALNWKE